MTISATADVGFVPPRVGVEVAVPSGNVMTSVSVWRNDSSGRSLVRSQPSAGFESRTVYDYECPFGQSVTYDWAAEYYDPAANATTFSEPWSSFPGSWTGDTASGSIAANVLTLAPTNKTITRTVSAAWDQIDVASVESQTTRSVEFVLAGSSLVGVSGSAGGNVQFCYQSAGGSIFVNPHAAFVPTGPLSIIRTPTGVAFTDGSASFEFAGTFGDITSVVVRSGSVQTEVGAITAQTFASTSSVAETSSAVSLSPTDAWLIAPQAPALSVPLSNSNQQAAGIRTLGPVSNATNTTVHRILGTSTPVATTTGNRQADTLSATVYTHTSDERQALKALLAPDTPILINVPPTWELDLDYGYYQVGDVTETRPYTLGGIPMRDFQLPLTRVRSPEVDVENPGWSYAQLATTWATYTELLTNYATYADVTADNRS